MYYTKLKLRKRLPFWVVMNELGEYSKQAHEEVGAYCNSKTLDMVVTIGSDAKRWLAPQARANGCVVHSFMNPNDAGVFVLKHLQEHAVVLPKGLKTVFLRRSPEASFSSSRRRR